MKWRNIELVTIWVIISVAMYANGYLAGRRAGIKMVDDMITTEVKSIVNECRESLRIYRGY